MFFSLLACSAPGPSFVALQGDSITVLEASSPLRNGILEMETEQGWEEQARSCEESGSPFLAEFRQRCRFVCLPSLCER